MIVNGVGMEGNSTVVEKITYSQDWPVYNKSQQEEKAKLMELLFGILDSIDEPAYDFGRPKMPLHDMIFASALKVYSQFSLRRFMTDLKFAKEQEFVDYTPCFASVGHFMQREDITPILKKLISISAMPLNDIETKFAVDSSGFRTTRFGEYCKQVHHTDKKHKWVKLHICCGVKTNIITAVEIGDEHHSSDTTQFKPLVTETSNIGFRIDEVSADKAYPSIANYNAVRELGGSAYIPFKSNTTALTKGNKAKLWRRMYCYFVMNREEFMQHYHLRSNVESTFFMIKAKFGDFVRSKSKTAQANELLLKVLCHNLCVLNQEAFRLGFMPNFSPL